MRCIIENSIKIFLPQCKMLLWVMCNMKSNLFSLNLFCSPKKRKTIVSDLTQSSFGPSLQWIPWQEIFSSNLWRNWKEITNSSSPLLCTWMDFEIYRNSFKGHHLETLSVFKIIASDTEELVHHIKVWHVPWREQDPI